MNEFVIHSVPGSPYGRAVFVALEEKRAPYRLVPVAPGSIRQPAHLALHPFGRVPILEHEDLRLYETQAILRYIDRVVPDPGLTPAKAKIAAKMDQLMNINDWYLFLGVGNVIAFSGSSHRDCWGHPPMRLRSRQSSLKRGWCFLSSPVSCMTMPISLVIL
jgi:glutathione S-transferase